MSIAGILEGHTLFQSLPLEDVRRISELSTERSYERGETIFAEGQTGTHLFLMLEGLVHLRLPASPPNFSIVVSQIEKGELFGVSPLLGSAHYTASATCEQRSHVLAMEGRPFRELLQHDCSIGFNIMSQVARIYFNRYVEVLRSFQRVVNQIPLIR
jgi:CRP-like cAMP-binding protein